MFSTRLVAMMETHAVTQQRLAERLDVAQASVSDWCNGAVPRRRIARELADAFGVRAEWLLDGEGEKLNEESQRAGEQVLQMIPVATKAAPPPASKKARDIARVADRIEAAAEELARCARELRRTLS